MKNNFAHLIKQELVNRFEDVVKNEIRQHNLAIKKTNDDVLELKKSFEDCLNDLKSLRKNQEENFNKTNENFHSEKVSIENCCNLHKDFIRDKLNIMNLKVEGLSEDVSGMEKSENFLAYRYEIQEFLKNESNVLRDIIRQGIDCGFLDYVKDKEFNIKSFNELKNANSVLSKNISVILGKIDSYKVESDGLLKELRMYKKDVFILEKKIEALMTIVDNLKARKV